MSMPIPANMWNSHSYSQPRNMHVCHYPNCQMAVGSEQMLCELHGAPHKPRQDVEDTDDE